MNNSFPNEVHLVNKYSQFTFSTPGLRAEVYMMEYSYFAYTYFAVDGMPIEMYGESWIAGLLTSDDVMLYMAGCETTRVM